MSEEIMESILSRLPPKSVMRFKCVHKSWHSLIISSSFIEKHLSMYNKHSTFVFCKHYIFRDINTKEKEVSCSLITFPNNDEHGTDSVVENIPIPIPPCSDIRTRGNFMDIEALFAASIIGHCNGVFCISFGLDAGSIVLWNPAIKDFKILPKQQCMDGAINSMAFGYDPKSKDYKVLDIVDPIGARIGEDRLVFGLPKVEVYTLSTNSWREIDNHSLETETTLFLPMFNQTFKNGVFYWIGCERQKEFQDLYDRNDEEWARQVISTFDMSNETFDHILFPYSLYDLNARYFYMHVISWKDSIALFGNYSFGALFTTDSYGVWVLNNLGGVHEGSWTKLLTIDVVLGMQKELVFWKSDEILMIGKDGRIFTHNIETGEFRYLPIDSLHADNCDAVVCVNSIVPVTFEKQQA